MHSGDSKLTSYNDHMTPKLHTDLTEYQNIMAELQAELAAQRTEMADLAELKVRLVEQEAEIKRLRQQILTKSSTSVPASGHAQATTRRTMLRRLGGAAAGLAAFGLVANTAFADSPAIDADGTGGATPSYGAQLKGDLAPLRLVPMPSSGRTSNTHASGELYTEDTGNGNGTLWYHTGTTTGWMPVTTTSFFNAPLRILGPYNTVNSTNPTVNTTPSFFKIEGSWTNNNPTPYSPNSGTIPSNATAIVGTIAVINPSSSGYLVVYPADQGTPVAVTLGYAGGSFVTTASVSVKLGAIPSGADVGKKGIAIYCYGSCNITFDVVGYII